MKPTEYKYITYLSAKNEKELSGHNDSLYHPKALASCTCCYLRSSAKDGNIPITVKLLSIYTAGVFKTFNGEKSQFNPSCHIEVLSSNFKIEAFSYLKFKDLKKIDNIYVCSRCGTHCEQRCHLVPKIYLKEINNA